MNDNRGTANARDLPAALAEALTDPEVAAVMRDNVMVWGNAYARPVTSDGYMVDRWETIAPERVIVLPEFLRVLTDDYSPATVQAACGQWTAGDIVRTIECAVLQPDEWTRHD